MAVAATSASVTPRCFENADWPMPTMAAARGRTAPLHGPAPTQPGQDHLVCDAVLRMRQLRACLPDRIEVVPGPGELGPLLVLRSRGVQAEAAFARIDVHVGERADDERRNRYAGQRALERGVRCQTGPGREPSARAHHARQALAVVADHGIAAEGEDRAQRPLRRIELRIEVPRIGERPVDQEVAALERQAGEAGTLAGRHPRDVLRHAETPAVPARLLAPLEGARVEPLAARP